MFYLISEALLGTDGRPNESILRTLYSIITSFLHFEPNLFDYVLYTLCLIGFCCWLAHMYVSRRKSSVLLADVAVQGHYREIFNSVNEAILILDAETGAVLDVNQAVFNLFGYTRDEILSGGLRVLLTHEQPYDFKSALALIHEASRSGALGREWSGLRKDGSRFWNDVSLRPVRIMDQDCVIIIARDVTERHKTYAEMSRLSGIIENTNDVVVTFSSDLKLTYVNPAGKKVLGWQDERKLSSISFRELHPDVARNTIEFGLSRAAFGGLWQGETFIRDSSGRTIPVSEVIIAHRDSVGAISYYSSIIRDLRQQKKAEEIIRARLQFLTQPEAVPGELNLAAIFDMERVQAIQDAFAKATGTGSIITAPDGKPLTRPSNFSPLCSRMRSLPESQQLCIRSGSRMPLNVSDGPFINRCQCLGFWDGGTKIMLNGKHVANWLIGQVRDSTLSVEEMLAGAEILGLDRETFSRELEKVPAMSREQFEVICSSLHLLAGQLSRLVLQNVQQARILHERNLAEKALRDNKEYLRSTLDSIGEGVISTDLSGNIVTMNRTAEELTGNREKDVANKPINDIVVLFDENQVRNDSIDLLETITDTTAFLSPIKHFTFHHHDGVDRSIVYFRAPIQDADGEIVGHVFVFRDITKEHQLEDQLRQSQKMEAVGKLAGGIAHEFNNLLQVILGYGEMIVAHLEEPKHKNMLQQVLTAGNSAKKLVRQLLAFSRSGFEPEKSITDLNCVLVDFKKMITRLLGEHITLKLTTADKAMYAYVDPAQIEQVLMNLCLNARDAMPDGGEMSISIYEYIYDGRSEPLPEIAAGHYVCCEVSDSGTGIPVALQKRIFEPFFTTKSVGQGTGLGLATSYGIIRKHDGIMTFNSRVSMGTTFRILLPGIDDKHAFEPGEFTGEDTTNLIPLPLEKISRVILLVEDEQTVRNLGVTILEEAGYSVITAADGQEGIDVYMRNAGKIDLALLDLVLPRKSGREVAEFIHKQDPLLPIIFCSGYNDDYIKAETITESLIHKPYEAHTLLQRIDAALSLQATITD